MNQIELGKNMVELGTMLQDKKATIQKLTNKAIECGFLFEFRLNPHIKKVEMEIIPVDSVDVA